MLAEWGGVGRFYKGSSMWLEKQKRSRFGVRRGSGGQPTTGGGVGCWGRRGGRAARKQKTFK